MKKVINLRNTLEGIGLDFYSKKDSKKFVEIKKELEKKNLNIDETRVEWDIENHEIHYPDQAVEQIFKDVYIRLKH